ncbi:MAG: hypothetical protein OXH08_01695 [Gammaproteobacteria bacterium]|nr:hypothetical protein [Gammaproteobacteria bacterium]MDE0649088.1 hypothetical protein [Gammaproteobacteria bacterium]
MEELLREWWEVSVVPVLGLLGAWLWRRRKKARAPRNRGRSLKVEVGKKFKLEYEAWEDQLHGVLPNPERSNDEDGEEENGGEDTELGNDDG